MEVPAGAVTGSPLLSWGLNLAVAEALEQNLRNARPWLDIDAVYVGPERPRAGWGSPAVIIDLGGVNFKTEGLAGYQPDPYNPASFREMYSSEGEIRLEVYGTSQEQLWTLQDFITQRYLGRALYTDSFFRTGQDVERMGIAYDAGGINWSGRSWVSPPWTQNEVLNHAKSTGSWKFYAEHYVYAERTRVAAIDITATPVRRYIDLTN